MIQSSCSSTIQKLLLATDSLGEEDLRHVRACENCRKLIERAADLESLLGENVVNEIPAEVIFERTEERAGELVARKSTVRFLIDMVLLGIIATGAILWTILAGFYIGKSTIVHPLTRPEFLSMWIPGIFVVTAILGTVLGLSIGRLHTRRARVVPPKWAALVPPLFALMFIAEYRFAQFLARDYDPWFAWAIALWTLTAAAAGYLPATLGLPYKRLRKGRMLSGVCLGIAERTKIPVGLIRLAFLVLLFAKLSGLLLYVVLDLLMQVHPDDRAALFRFRFRRWWDSFVSHRVARPA